VSETYLPTGIDPSIAARHLKLLEPNGTFLFQSFDERKKDKRPELTRVTTDMAELAQMHVHGAGAYVVVNKTVNGGRKSEDIPAIRAVWSEQDDGVVRKFPIDATFTIETSPGHFHHYWCVDGEWPTDADGREDFASVMERMVADHGCDKAAKDISRVLRLAGSLHRKSLHIEGAARRVHQIRIVAASAKRYTRAQLLEAFPPVEPVASAPTFSHDDDPMLLSALDCLAGAGANADYDGWIRVGMALKDKYGERGFLTWMGWSRQNYSNFSESECQAKWKSFKRNGVSSGTIIDLAHKAGWRPDQTAYDKVIARHATPKPDPESAPEPAAAEKPVLIIYGGDLPAAAKVLAKLFADNDTFFDNGNAPIRVVADANDMPRAVEADADLVRTMAHELAVPKKVTPVGLVEVTLSTNIANLYLHGLVGNWGLKPFRGITTAPVLNDDGDIRVAAGYDHDSGLWCHNVPSIQVEDRPTENEARAALLRLRERFRTFPFADCKRIAEGELQVVDISQPPGLDESTFMVALMTAVCRQSLQLAPGFLCDAPSLSGAGTGKGLLVKAVSIVASGAPPSAFTGGHDEEELDKRLTSALIAARPALFLDNLNAKELKSDVLASALTEPVATVRPFGKTVMVPLYTRTFIAITGNGVQIAEDMARRILKISLDAEMENPEQRKFRPGFLRHVYRDRAALLADVLTIWRWGRQTPLEPGIPLRNYEDWAQWCRDPLLALDCQDPVKRVVEIKAQDPRRQAAIAFFDVWWERHGDHWIETKDVGDDIIAQIGAAVNTTGIPSRQQISRFLTNYVGVRAGGYIFSRGNVAGVRTRQRATYQVSRRGVA
jgi:hypothetical protein